MKTTAEFGHRIGDRVLIAAIGIVGQVDALMTSINGPEYRVIFWNDATRSSLWLYPHEIDPASARAERVLS